MDIQRLEQNDRRSRVVVFSNVAYLSGQFSEGSGDIGAQTHDVLSKIDDLLSRVGTDKSNLLTAQIWLKTMKDFDAMNEVWDAWTIAGHKPTRCCGVVEMAYPNMLLEVVVSAAVPPTV